MRAAPEIVALFDIDRTLIETGGSSPGHFGAFADTFEKVCNIKTDIDVIEYHGLTDKQIIAEVLRKHSWSQRQIEEKSERCAKHLELAFRERIGKGKIIVLPGVVQLLKELKKRGVLLGLVTGNLEPIAEGKLKKVNLMSYFSFGGFGSDDPARSKLVKVAIRRAKQVASTDQVKVYLIGDAPADMRAGRENDVATIGVMTGAYNEKQLDAAGADLVFKDFRNPLKIVRAITAQAGS